MVKGGSIPSSSLERSCSEWSNQNLFKDWKVIAVGTMLTIDETAITHLEYGEPYAVKVACTVREGAGYFANPPISCAHVVRFIYISQKSSLLRCDVRQPTNLMRKPLGDKSMSVKPGLDN